jgi:transposase
MGIEVLEVERPEHRRRSSRSNLQKSDPSDAEAAARAVLAGEASGVPKSADGRVEMIRALRAARRSAIKARTQAANQLQALRMTAPEELRHRLRALSTKKLVCVAARFRLAGDPHDVPTATKFTLRSVARRYEVLSEEIAELEAHLGLAIEDLLQARHRDRVRGGYHPDRSQGLLGRARSLSHRLHAPSWGRGARRRVESCSLCPKLPRTLLCSYHVPFPSLSVRTESEGSLAHRPV